jgi:hypothetical protein
MSQYSLGVLAFGCTVVFVGAMVATIGLLIRAQWTRRPNGSRRPPRTRSRHEVWPDPAGITPAGRPYERLARWTALVALFALAAALVVLSVGERAG